MEIDFKTLETEVIELLDKNKIWVLATSSNDRVTARSISIVNEGLRIYFQTDKNFIKYKQIVKNPNVALCYGNVQIEGTAKIKGHPLDEVNQRFVELYRKCHEGSFLRYSHLKNQVVIEIEPKLITLWKYIDSEPFRDYLYVDSLKVVREHYCPEE